MNVSGSQPSSNSAIDWLGLAFHCLSQRLSWSHAMSARRPVDAKSACKQNNAGPEDRTCAKEQRNGNRLRFRALEFLPENEAAEKSKAQQKRQGSRLGHHRKRVLH